ILRASLHSVTSLHQEPCGRSKTNARKWSFQQVTPGSIAWAAVIAIFLLSPDTEFPGSGVGKSSMINYRDLFFQYKKMLVSKWDTRRIKNIIASIENHIFGTAKCSTLNPAGGEDFSEEINRAMLALDMSSDSEADEAPQALSALSALSL
ncbi:hypothetical protein F4604DRAFT_1530314, partial [Suillus subluteus]